MRSRNHLRAALRDYGLRRWETFYLIWSVVPTYYQTARHFGSDCLVRDAA